MCLRPRCRVTWIKKLGAEYEKNMEELSFVQSAVKEPHVGHNTCATASVEQRIASFTTSRLLCHKKEAQRTR